MKIIDKISFEYWRNNYKKGTDSKTFYVYHNGFKYGQDMEAPAVGFSYVDNDGKEIFYKEKVSKDNYLLFIEAVCNNSPSTLKTYFSNKDKFRIFEGKQGEEMDKKRRTATRLRPISVNGEKLYLATNLKIGEYIHSVTEYVSAVEREKCNILLLAKDDEALSSKNEDDTEEIEIGKKFHLHIISKSDKKKQSDSSHKRTPRESCIDFEKVNAQKMYIGNFGEELVMIYERERLLAAGHPELAAQIEWVSKVNSSAGYDIHSYTEDGKDLLIEVKSTRKNNPYGFYISENECKVSREKGDSWCIYRVYAIDEKKGEANLEVYQGTIDSEKYEMKPISWQIISDK